MVAADTVVTVGTRVLGKPRDRDDAHRMIGELSGRDHHVLTGVAVRLGDTLVADVATTRVSVRALA